MPDSARAHAAAAVPVVLRAGTRWLDPVAAGLGIALAALTFITTGGTDLGPNTWTEIASVLLGTAAGTLLLLRHPGRVPGGSALLLFGALAALTLASVAWSLNPSASWIEANRTLAYLAVFASGVVLARLAPMRWPSLVLAVAVAATAVCGYALLVKVFPAALDRQEVIGRLRAPFTYWNAVGLIAAMGIIPCLWAGAQRDAGRLRRALSVPAMSVLTVALILSYSRGALLVAVVGLATWFTLVPLRLRAAALLGTALLAAALATGWALATKAITSDHPSLASRVTAGHAFGLVLLAIISLGFTGGVLALWAIERRPASKELRRKIGIALITAVACLPAVGVLALAASSRGLTGEISHLTSQLTDTRSTGLGDNAGRLVRVSNSRARYWSEAFKVGEHHLLLGSGALGFATAHSRYASDGLSAGHAHGYLIETFADLGLLGLLLSLGLLAAWVLAVRLTLGPLRRGAAPNAPPAVRAEREGLVTMGVVVLMFGVHSTIDWTWFIPGVAVPALLLAGWLAGRGPVDESLAGQKATAQVALPSRRVALCAAAASALVGGLISYQMWQPLGSEHAQTHALAELSAGHTNAALADAGTAIARNPLAIEPLLTLSTVEASSGHLDRAHAAIVRAVRLQPSNPASWLALGEFDNTADRPFEAIRVLRAAEYLAPNDRETLGALFDAQYNLSAARAKR